MPKSFLVLMLLSAGASLAQDTPPVTWGDFQATGSATFGYRFNDINGYEPKFQELFDLRSGFRLVDFNLSGTAKSDAKSPFADHFGISASGLGDPFPTEQLTLSKSKVYDLRATYRQSYYYWNQNDAAVQPSGLHGLTSNQDWGTVRRFGSISLKIDATNRLKLRFEYGRAARDGFSANTVTMQYFNSPSNWGSFLRDNPYYVEAPLSESSNRVAAGFDYALRNWAFHYTLGYQQFTQSMNWGVSGPVHSINKDSTANGKEFLDSGSWNQYRSLKTPSSEFSYNGKIGSRLDLRGSFLFFRYSGPATASGAFAGTARTDSSGATVVPYDVTLSTTGQLTEPNYVVDQGFSYRMANWATLHGDYRYSRFTEDNRFTQNSNDGTTLFTGTTDQQWRQGLHQGDLMVEVTPFTGLVVTPGIRYVKRDTTNLNDGVADASRSERVKTVWPMGRVAWIPSRKFSIRADLQSITNGNSYTRITPHTDVSTRWVVRYQPVERLSIEENFVIRNRKLIDTDFVNTIRSTGGTISWAWNNYLSTFAGFAYDSFFATASVSFIRGVAPLTTSWRDQTVSRVWQGGLSTHYKRLVVTFSGNFVRSTGVGEITGELPTQGPLTFPMGTLTGYYDVPVVGRLSVDLQRTYYAEEIVTGNNFSANLLMVRWTRSF